MSKAITSFILSSSFFVAGMSSVERVEEYALDEDIEDKWEKDEDKLIEENWPSSGNVEIKNLKVRYRKNLPLVLNGVSFDIKSGENVAIVGRTGSGKSTTLLVLMRIIEIDKEEGEESYIKIDNVDISKLGLHKLRKNLTIIPQDPFMLQGTLKGNIDPMKKYTDLEIFEALEEVEFWSTLTRDQQLEELEMLDMNRQSEMSSNFDMDTFRLSENNESLFKNSKILELKVESKGSNFSLGQRQLICIARALIQKPKILLMDEATASIDLRSDEIIQKVIKRKMKDTTVITIAHRLNTVLHYDKIVVLDNGELAEIGTPDELMKIDGGKFKKMVEEHGNDNIV